ncbi:hypothetical protein LCGC14_3074060 [marine sediment metagenome]|uniref:Uncharacterized protein n=1 Tax=marine sediment metagenome TaxID=412755 RepID=A0A0F8X3M8_9ZZZZ
MKKLTLAEKRHLKDMGVTDRYNKQRQARLQSEAMELNGKPICPTCYNALVKLGYIKSFTYQTNGSPSELLGVEKRDEKAYLEATRACYKAKEAYDKERSR